VVSQNQIEVLKELQVAYHHQIVLPNQLQTEHLNQLLKKVDSLQNKQLQKK